VLKVIHQQQGGLAREEGDQLLERLPVGRAGQAQRLQQLIQEQPGISQVDQRHEPWATPPARRRRPALNGVAQPFRDLQGEPGLTAASHARQRHQVSLRLRQQRLQVSDIFLAAEEAGKLQRQIAGRHCRPERRNFR
jgi:hypothetical protein